MTYIVHNSEIYVMYNPTITQVGYNEGGMYVCMYIWHTINRVQIKKVSFQTNYQIGK